MAKEKISSYPSNMDIYRRNMKYDEKKETWSVDDQAYCKIPDAFGKTLTELMKNGSFWEDITVINDVEYMRQDKFDAYQKLAKALSQSK